MLAERAGDVAAYEKLLEEEALALRVVVRGRLSRLGMHLHEVEDIVQEVLIGLHTRRRQWSSERPFMPWLHAIVRYKITDAARRRSRERRRRLDLSLEEWVNIADAGGHSQGASIDVERALDGLPQRQRQVVEALAIEGESVKDIARRTGTSEGAVRLTLHRALKKIAFVATLGEQEKAGRRP
jgi:RNA polymerase sigma-70 factor (ECF subfamily)